jgi:hypothetical protein
MLTGRSDSAHAAHRMRLHITCRRPRLQGAKGIAPTAGLRLQCSRMRAARHEYTARSPGGSSDGCTSRISSRNHVSLEE